MNVDWPDGRCILCLGTDSPSREHVIPEWLGGRLAVDGLLCRECNSRLGHRVEAEARSDPGIRLAVNALRQELPSTLLARLEREQDFRAQSDGGEVLVRRTGKKAAPRIRVEHDETGSPTKLDTPLARRFLEAQAAKTGATTPEVERALRAFDEAGEGVAVDFPGGFAAVKRNLREVEPVLTGQLMSELLPLKVAYEFLALWVQDKVFDRQLDPIRQALLGRAPVQEKGFRIELLRGPSYEAAHWIVLHTGDDDHIVIDVVLFGWHVYRVHFSDVALRPVRFGYQADLKASTDSWVLPE